MHTVFMGVVKEVGLRTLKVEDRISHEVYDCQPALTEQVDFSVGDAGIWVGELRNGIMTVKRYETKKFLDPMYEEDLFAASGKYSLIGVLNDPFTEAFVQFMENRKLEEEQQELSRAAREAMKALLELPENQIRAGETWEDYELRMQIEGIIVDKPEPVVEKIKKKSAGKPYIAQITGPDGRITYQMFNAKGEKVGDEFNEDDAD